MSDAFIQLSPDLTGPKIQTVENASEHAALIAPIDSSGLSNSYVQIEEDSTGKKFRYFQNTIGGSSVHALAVTPVDSSGDPLI